MKPQHFAVVAVAVVLAWLPIGAQMPSVPPGGVEFAAHTIGTELRGGYQAVVTDLNKDGKPDVLAVASGVPELVWYENPAWQRHVIVGGITQMINAAPYDIDGDGIPEIAFAYGFSPQAARSAGNVVILTHGADVTQPWTAREIDKVPTAHRLRWIDADGSGKKVLAMAPLTGADAVAPDYRTPVSIVFYRPPDFKREVITDTFTGLIHGIEPVAWDGVKGQALLSAGFNGVYLHRFAAGKWTPSQLMAGDPEPWPKSGSSDVALGKLGSQRFLATIEPWHGNQIAIYKPSGSTWQRQKIDDTITDGHTIVTIDVDGDGRDEVVAGQRGGEKSLIIYAASPNGESWTRRVVDEGGMAGAGCAASDLNADKRPDIVCIGTSTANVKWYENLGKKR
jgi:hypothetical protein